MLLGPASSRVRMLDVSVRRRRLGWVSAADAGRGQNEPLGGWVLSTRSPYRYVLLRLVDDVKVNLLQAMKVLGAVKEKTMYVNAKVSVELIGVVLCFEIYSLIVGGRVGGTKQNDTERI